MQKGFKIFLIIVLIVVLLGVFAYVGGTKNMDEVKAYVLPQIDLTTIENGTYEGSCEIGRWAMDVKVTVKDHQFINIIMSEDRLSNITPELADTWNDEILFIDDPSFDAISGATITSKAYMIAITNALEE